MFHKSIGMNIGEGGTRVKAKKFMEQVQKLDTMIQNKLIEIEQWKSIAEGSMQVGGERVQSSGNQQKMADAISRYVDIENEIKNEIDILYDTKKDVLRVIEQLNAREYDFLHKVYIQNNTIAEVAEMYGNSYSWATTIHGKALKNVQKILDGRENRNRY